MIEELDVILPVNGVRCHRSQRALIAEVVDGHLLISELPGGLVAAHAPGQWSSFRFREPQPSDTGEQA